MTDGLTTGRAHLDPMDSVAPTGGEIDDVELLAWLRTTDPERPPIAVPGRYLRGYVRTSEAEAGPGFCLRAYGVLLDPQRGLRLTREFEMARGPDGSVYLWSGRRKRPGRELAGMALEHNRVKIAEASA